MRARFVNAVEIGDLVVKLGTWKETEQDPQPSIPMLLRAKVWTEAKHEGLRKVLADARQLPTVAVSDSLTVGKVVVPDDQQGHAGGQALLYKVDVAGTVPAEILSTDIRLLVVAVVGQSRADHLVGPTRTGSSRAVVQRDGPESGVESKRKKNVFGPGCVDVSGIFCPLCSRPRNNFPQWAMRVRDRGVHEREVLTV